MKLITKPVEPTVVLELTQREAQVIEQALYLASKGIDEGGGVSSFATECGGVDVDFQQILEEEEIDLLNGNTK